MKNEDIMNKIKEQTRDIEVPESLEPKNIEVKLKDLSKTRNKNYKKSIFQISSIIVAAILLMVLIPNIKANLSSIDTSNLKGKVSGSSSDIIKEEAVEIVSPIPRAESYKYLYKEFKKLDKGSLWTNMLSDGMANLTGGAEKEMAVEDSSTSVNTSANTSKDYSTTNIQVEGVDEGDIIKTDGNYIYLSNEWDSTVKIIKVDGDHLELMSEIKKRDSNSYIPELYIDGNRLAIIETSYEFHILPIDENGSMTARKNQVNLNIYDISDRRNPELLSSLTQDGTFQSSRKSGDYIYLFTNYYANMNTDILRSEDVVEAYVPSVNSKPLAIECIYIPVEINSTGYVVATSTDINNPSDFTDEMAVVANAAHFYVSNENIYIVNGIWGRDYDEGKQYNESEILKFSYKDGRITPAATGTFKGSINDSFSLDEYNGYLRVVSTVYHYQTYNNKEMSVSSDDRSNSLYVLDSNLKISGSIENLAPSEQIYSARFFGDTGYFVTFRNVDPLFSVDLSDPQNPKILGELKISGFSEYLHFYSEDLLLGLGYEADVNTGSTTGVKLSMFDVSNPKDVKEIHKLVLTEVNHSPALYNHRAVLISPERNIIAFMVEGNYQYSRDNYSWFSEYRTFSYDREKGFSQNLVSPLADNNNRWNYYVDARGIYIDNYLYIIGYDYQISIYDLNSNTLVDKWMNP
ncbi:MAG: hypothetical protein GX913_06395 [Clostridiales bacterium]|nr:hypothetical protein [Clostridiales bacterium]